MEHILWNDRTDWSMQLLQSDRLFMDNYVKQDIEKRNNPIFSKSSFKQFIVEFSKEMKVKIFMCSQKLNEIEIVKSGGILRMKIQ